MTLKIISDLNDSMISADTFNLSFVHWFIAFQDVHWHLICCPVHVVSIYGHSLQWPSFDTQAEDGASLYLNRTNRNCKSVSTSAHTEFLLWNPASWSLNSMPTSFLCSEGLEPGSWKHKTKKEICKLCCNPWFCLFLIHVYVFLYIHHLGYFFWFDLLQETYHSFRLVRTWKFYSLKKQCVRASVSGCRCLAFGLPSLLGSRTHSRSVPCQKR